MRKLLLFFCLLGSCFCLHVYANNISVSNVAITGQSTSASTCKVQFDISWQNSWRNSLNYDAAWVFIKYSTDSGTTWAHATLKANDTNPLDDSPSLGYSAGSGTSLSITIPTDKKGAFLYRSATGAGTVNTTSIQFVWDWGSDKLSNDPNTAINAGSTVRLKVFALEMVYVPQAAFYVGDGASDASQFTSTEITTGTASAVGGYPTGQTAPNSSWPNGYNAFYIMKYELSQGMYVDFFNTLTATQKTERDITGNHATYGGKNSDSTLFRNTISWSSGNASGGANSYVACNYLAWADLCAFGDWAALRPITELEYEKVCRGANTAVASEYAWGSTTITQVNGITDSGGASETASNSGNGLCVYGNNASVQGPLRVGFAATSSTNRVESGASYYGVMELSGNLWERAVTIGSATGRLFTGSHGDGSLDSTGNANVTNWPGTDAIGSGLRGSAWNTNATYARVSDRYNAAYTDAERISSYGGRSVRTAP
jgi:hypothetical protein